MKITFLGPAYPYRGGLAAFNERLARQLISEGKDADIKTFTLQYPAFLFPGKTQFTVGPPPEDIRITRELNSINPFSWIRTGLKLKKERADILIIRYWIPFLAPCLGIVARIVKSNKYTLVISIVDNAIPHEKRVGDRMLTKFFLKSIDGAIALSEFVQKDIEVMRHDIPVCLSPHPLFDNYGRRLPKEEALASLKLDPAYSYLLFFGIIREYKGLSLLIEALASVRIRNKKIRLIVAGEFYDNPAPYKKLIKKYNLEDEIIFFDHFINDSDVRLFFCAADLVVQPYKSATQSGVTQIAFYFDKPVLVTKVGGLKEFVEHNRYGYVVNPEPRFISEAIADYFEKEREKDFSAALRKEKEKYSWHKMTESITEVFYKCLLQQLISSL
ncbi:MAG TPA: glycosyltransferase [Bacteroidales bacterium]|nr:glycosyltransferase [Bacteroidales bacterium]